MYGTLMEWKKKFMTKSLEDSENDPEVLYLELERIRQRIQSISNECIKDEDMITQILNQMPDAYKNKVNHIKHLIDTGKEPTLVEVVGHLREKFISLNKDNTLDSKATSNTKALIVKQFKGYCRECGEYGHKKANCPKLKKNDRNHKSYKKSTKKNCAKNLTCHYCGKKGHIERDCFKKKRCRVL